MKKLLFIALIVTAFVSCKNASKSEAKESAEATTESTETQSNALTLLKGEFVYFDGAAVLQTDTEIYGVLITDTLEELNEKAKQYKSEPTDMVQVEIQGKISNEKHETILWDNKVEVIEIIDVQPNTKDKDKTIKLGS
jgi:hypothetical protein